MALQTIDPNVGRQRRRKPGPAQAGLVELGHPYVAPRPIQRIERSYSLARKVEVVRFLHYHRVVDDSAQKARVPRLRLDIERPTIYNGNPMTEGLTYRPPTFIEASTYFKIPTATIRYWWANRLKIDGRLNNGNVSSRAYHPKWPGLEEELAQRFYDRRKARELASRGWFRRQACSIFKALYPESEAIFTFSNGWFGGFCRRHNIVRRRLTNQASRRPDEYIQIVNNFLK